MDDEALFKTDLDYEGTCREKNYIIPFNFFEHPNNMFAIRVCRNFVYVNSYQVSLSTF